MAFAHAFDLTHGKLDPSQILCLNDGQLFKVTGFRPWLAHNDIQISKCKDLFDFGTTLYSLMVGKRDINETQGGTEVNKRNCQEVSFLDQIPLGWLKLQECAPLL
jgi:hypothetical protein